MWPDFDEAALRAAIAAYARRHRRFRLVREAAGKARAEARALVILSATVSGASSLADEGAAIRSSQSSCEEVRMFGAKKLSLAAACAVLTVAMVPDGALAGVSASHPWGGSTSTIPVQAYLATDVLSGSQWVSWRRIDTGACAFQQVGDTLGTWGQVRIYGGAGDDQIFVVSTTMWVCGYQVQPPILDGMPIIFGNDGNDRLVSGLSAEVWMSGGEGNDFLLSASPIAVLDGGYGNDTIRATATSGSGLLLYGGDDDDCIRVNSGLSPSEVSCGNDYDTWSGPGSRPSDCEQTSALYCPLDQIE